MSESYNKEWGGEEIKLLFYGFLKKIKLDDLVNNLNELPENKESHYKRTQNSIVTELLRLSIRDKKTWLPRYSFYGHQFYELNRKRFLRKSKNYYSKHKKRYQNDYLINIVAIRKNQKKYYEEIVKKRKYKESGIKLMDAIKPSFGEARGSKASFARYLLEKGIISSYTIVYTWFNGYKLPRKIDEICKLLNIDKSFLLSNECLESRIN